MAKARTLGAARLVTVVLTTLMTGCGSGDSPPATASFPAQSDVQGGQPQTIDAAESQPARPAQVSEQDANHPVVIIKTSLGEVHVQLDAENAPVTVDNFLANYVWTGHYDQTIFHHVEQGKMAIGGAFTGDVQSKPTRTEIANEAYNGLKNERGTIAMARHPDYVHSANCQFFFNLADNPSLDHKGRDSASDYGYCVFGKVIQGLEVVDKIGNVAVRSDGQFAKLPVESVLIQTISVAQ